MNEVVVALFGHDSDVLCSYSQPDSICVMGDKFTARDIMKNAGVPTVPRSDGLLEMLIVSDIINFIIKMMSIHKPM